MYEFHKDKDRYFDMQYRVTKDYILPMLQQHAPGKKWSRVLEIGCAEAGVLKCFLEEGDVYKRQRWVMAASPKLLRLSMCIIMAP